jgi:deoxyribonuclease V
MEKTVERVCGMDVSYIGELGAGAAAVFSYPDLELLEERIVLKVAPTPYVSTFLAFREMPYLLSLIRSVRTKPDVFMINGHGVYHPVFLGAASHFGVVFDVPAVGVAGNPLRLRGEARAGGHIFYGNRRVASMLGCRGKRGSVYVSVGHRITLDEATTVVRNCLREHRMPEPLFLADAISREAVREAN